MTLKVLVCSDVLDSKLVPEQVNGVPVELIILDQRSRTYKETYQPVKPGDERYSRIRELTKVKKYSMLL